MVLWICYFTCGRPINALLTTKKLCGKKQVPSLFTNTNWYNGNLQVTVIAICQTYNLPMWLVHHHTFINALPKNSCFLLFTFVFTVTLSPSYSLIQIDITVTASDGDCYMSNFRPRQCGLFIVILSSTLSLKTVHRTVLLTVAFKSRHRLLA